MAWIPGFSRAPRGRHARPRGSKDRDNTAINWPSSVSALSPLWKLSLQDLDLAVDHQDLGHLGVELGIAPLQVVFDLVGLLAAERVAVYPPVDARGVLGQSMFDASLQAQDYTRPAAASPIGGGPSRFSQDTQLGALQTGAEHASMDVVAQETGGRAVHDSNGLKEALADALSDGSNFYSVAYVPPERKDGQSGAVFHTIEVKVDGAKYQLAYRRGYYTDDTSRPTENTGKVPEAMTQAAVLGAPPLTQIVFQAQVLPESATETNGAGPIDNVAGEKTTSFPGRGAPMQSGFECAATKSDFCRRNGRGGTRTIRERPGGV